MNAWAALVRTQIWIRLSQAVTSSQSRGYYKSRTRKPNLYSEVSPLGNPGRSVAPVLDGWVQGGNKVRFAELQRIIRDFRRRKRFSHALEVSEWTQKNGLFVFSPVEHAVQLDLIGRVHGLLSAENYFANLMDHEKTYKTYGALLSCYVRQHQVEKSLSHIQKMREKGFDLTALTYNNMMCLFTKIGQHDKVPDVLAEMKENKVLPDNFSYRICMNSYGERSDIEGMEELLREMETQPHIAVDWNTYAVAANFYIKPGLTKKALDALKRSEERLTGKDGIGYNQLISLHTTLGNRTEILRLWELEKIACKRCINKDYINILKSLVKLGELEEAEKVLKEWESSGNCHDFRIPDTVIAAYSEKGLPEKAKMLLENLMDKGKETTPDSWAGVAAGYWYKGDVDKAVKSMKVAFSLPLTNKRWKPDPKLITAILNWLGDNGSVADVEAFAGFLSTVPVSREIDDALRRAGSRESKI
ncbi:pentatricopeptide repeat-containing protein At4g21705, mitochondrial [Rhodamnia argentea]|uniref:Pentatricopeptide repeat-containing protein At4g21705, mitochondrial n=1 Tax=Rhodamnia argentea TaxID=178133 RepID=A0A8B8P1M2_9MYRT|nr:pentatricopeptide repeat-containing protein At4g21705, mitochondrial [Rhodamnia argentea]